VSSIAGTVNGVVNPTYTYDANGNMTAGAGRTIGYTSYNLTSTLTQGSTSIAFTYDSEHARIKQVGPAGATTYLDDPTSAAMAEQVVSGSTTTWHDYILAPGTEPGAGDMIAERIGGNGGVGANWGSVNWGSFTWGGASLLYFTVDQLESIAVIANPSASVTERDSYDAWGRRRNPNGTDNTACAITSETTRGFTGQEMMDSVCTVNLNARIYDPTIARFMAADPLSATLYDLQTLDRYSYVNNRPLDKTDPTGAQIAGGADDIAVVVGVVAVGMYVSGQCAVNQCVSGAYEQVAGAVGSFIRKGDQTPGSRPGKDFTKKGKDIVKGENKEKNGGVQTCEGCGTSTTPAQQGTKGVSPSDDETHVDHVKPKSNGGSGTPENGQVLCRKCNLAKGDKPPTPKGPDPDPDSQGGTPPPEQTGRN
jgi:RHS repeat-associated protein